jgi:competence protein ComEA
MTRIRKSFLILIVFMVATAGFMTAEPQKESSGGGGKALVNINTAGATELEKLPGIGPSLAKKIVEFRQKNGNFKSTSDLTAVQGIGEKKFEQIKSLVTVK